MRNLIPEEHLNPSIKINFAPMIDFMFIMLAIFATFAISRSSLFESNVDLVKLKNSSKKESVSPRYPTSQINLTISSKGEYSWMTEVSNQLMGSSVDIQQELLHQYQIGVLPEDKQKTQILLHIDRNAPWEKVAELLFAIRQVGFEAHPLYLLKEGTK